MKIAARRVACPDGLSAADCVLKSGLSDRLVTAGSVDVECAVEKAEDIDR